jgi:hypothetical protein
LVKPPATAGGTDLSESSLDANSEPISINFASEFPTTHSTSSGFRSEFTGPARAPIFQHAKYAIMYSGEFGSSKLTTSPFVMPFASSMFAVRLTAELNSP